MLCSFNVMATTHTVSAETVNINAVIAKANPGDRILFLAGRYQLHLNINKRLIVEGEAGAILDGNNEGDVIRVSASGVIIKGFRIEASGQNLTEMNAAIFVEPTASNTTIEHNFLYKNGFGIWLDAVTDARVLNNRIQGDVAQRSQDRGNGIHLYNTKNSLIQGNEVWQTRDGIYIDTSQHNTLDKNTLHDLRYGVHYMYSYHNKVTNNQTYNTRTGYALMQSKYLTVTGNTSEADGNYGILLNFITHSTLANNKVINVKQGAGYVTGGSGIIGAEGKAIFIYNSQFNQIHHNLFSNSDIGIHLTAGSEDNQIYGNAFVLNRTQVKYVANRQQDWTYEGRGNFWSDYLGWDLNSDGIGDKHYEPNDAVDKLLWKYPVARVLMNSPAIETLRWAQEKFPVLKPQGVRDSAPLMHTTFLKRAVN